jgi:peroxin-11B
MSTAVEKKKVFNVDSFLKTLESTNGRDKLGKLIQYVARLSAWYLSRYNPSDKASIAQATGVQKGVASARKLTRLLKWWPLLIKLWDAIVKKGFNQSLVEHLRNISSFGMANYFFWDNMSWAVGVGLIKGDNAKFSKWSMYGWFFGLVFAVIIDTLDL